MTLHAHKQGKILKKVPDYKNAKSLTWLICFEFWQKFDLIPGYILTFLDVNMPQAVEIYQRIATNSQSQSGLLMTWFLQGAVSIRKTVLPGMAIPMLKIRRPNGRLIFNMEIAIRR